MICRRGLSSPFFLGVALAVGGYIAAATPTVSDPSQTAPDAAIKTPVRNDKAHPFEIPGKYYPIESRRNHEEGDCVVRILVDPSGAVSAMQLVRSTIYQRLDDACLAAFAEGRFIPATVNGKPVSAWATIPTAWRVGRRSDVVPLPRDFDSGMPKIAKNYPLHVGFEFYPEAARMMHQGGICGVHLVVEADGTLSDVRIQQSTGFASLDEASIEAIKQAKFSRGTLDGVPIAASTVLYLIWRLPET